MREVLGLRELGGDDAEEVLAPHDAERAGEPGDAEPGDGGVAAQGWRRRAAAGVVIALFLGVGYMLSVGRPEGGGRPPGAGGPDIAQAPAAPTARPVEEAARAALIAWARFAETGDVEQVGAVFDRGGPQFARLRAEAPEVAALPAAGGAPYVFSATGMRVGAGSHEDERVVVADVVVSRLGETDQRFGWELVMRKHEGRWRLWTVRERAALAGGRPGVGP